MKKPFLAAVLCLCLMLALLPATAQTLTDAEILQMAIDGAYASGSLALSRAYQGGGGSTSVSITSPLILDLNGWAINDIALNIGNPTTTPVVTIKDSGGNGQVNYNGVVKNAINVSNGSLTVESGTFIGDRDGGSAIEISGGSVTIRGGTFKGDIGINFLGGNLIFDCAVGQTATIESVGPQALSLANPRPAPVTVAANTRVKINNDVKTADDLKRNITDTITLDIRPAPSSITPPAPLTVVMSDTPAYSGEFILAGEPLPVVSKVTYTKNGGLPSETYNVSWEAATKRVKVLTDNLNPGIYTVTVEDAVNSVSSTWQVTIEPFVVPVTADKSAVAPNRYIIDPGETITFTADTRNMPTNRDICWDVSDLSYQSVVHYLNQRTLTLTPTEGIRCRAYAYHPPLSSIVAANITVYFRVAVTQGANSRWLRDNADGLRFVTTGKEADFYGIYIDSVANEIPRSVSDRKYNFSSDPVTGGTIVTLLPALLSTLPDGPHTLTFQYNDRENTASTGFFIGDITPGGGEAGSGVPKTGDSAPLAPLCGLVLLSGAGLAASVALGRRKRRGN